MRTIKREIVSALIISEDNKLFLGKKDPAKGGVYSDCWHIPGGGIEERENLLEGLQREILEETGIDINSYAVKLIDNEGHGTSEKTLGNGEKVLCEMNFNVYQVNINNKKSIEIDIKLSDDLVEYKWTSFNDLGSVKLTPPSKELFKKLNLI